MRLLRINCKLNESYQQAYDDWIFINAKVAQNPNGGLSRQMASLFETAMQGGLTDTDNQRCSTC
jgi:hypothetical protein